MTKNNSIFHGDLNNDFQHFMEILFENDLYESSRIDLYRKIHSKIYVFKELINNIEYNDINKAKNFIYDTLGSFIEFTYLISKYRYKSAAMVLRGSMETFAKFLVFESGKPDTYSFTNNIESSFANITNEFIVNYRKQQRNRDFKRVFGDEYRVNTCSKYWELCDIVHSKDTVYNHCFEFLDSIINSELDDIKEKYLINLAIDIVGRFMVIIVIFKANSIFRDLNGIMMEIYLDLLHSKFDDLRPYL